MPLLSERDQEINHLYRGGNIPEKHLPPRVAAGLKPMANVVVGRDIDPNLNNRVRALQAICNKLGVTCHILTNRWHMVTGMLHLPGATLADFCDEQSVRETYKGLHDRLLDFSTPLELFVNIVDEEIPGTEVVRGLCYGYPIESTKRYSVRWTTKRKWPVTRRFSRARKTLYWNAFGLKNIWSVSKALFRK